MNKYYTYLIGWSTLNKWYYGVRYSKKSNPDELWKTYFTSSEYVKQFRKEYGEPDVIQIRKTFSNAVKARVFEHKVLKRLNVITEDKWLNKTNNISFDPIILRECKLGNKNPMYDKTSECHPWFGHKHTQESRDKISKSSSGSNNAMFGKKQKKVTCPHCKKTIAINMAKRWHFDNCGSHKKMNRTPNKRIFINLINREYLYCAMNEFAELNSFNYQSMAVYFNKGRSYKNWIRLY